MVLVGVLMLALDRGVRRDGVTVLLGFREVGGRWGWDGEGDGWAEVDVVCSFCGTCKGSGRRKDGLLRDAGFGVDGVEVVYVVGFGIGARYSWRKGLHGSWWGHLVFGFRRGFEVPEGAVLRCSPLECLLCFLRDFYAPSFCNQI